MKKLYYGFLMLGTLVGLQSISYGSAAAPAKETIKMIYVPRKGQSTIEYQKKIPYNTIISCKWTSLGEITCQKWEQMLDKDGFCILKVVTPLHRIMYYSLKEEYETQEKAKEEAQEKAKKSAATEQVPGGYMAPTAAGDWKPVKPGSSGSKKDK